MWTMTAMAMALRWYRWRTRMDTTSRTRMMISMYACWWVSYRIQYTYNSSKKSISSSSLSNLKSNNYNKNDTRRKTKTLIQYSTRISAMRIMTTMSTTTATTITITITITITMTIIIIITMTTTPTTDRLGWQQQ